ncbi:MAG: hypothetical protein K6F46_00320 [Desulfovibrio sp.]|nr:hypothetical protein [Desulfovibrio sp.]
MKILYSCVLDAGDFPLWQFKVWVLSLKHLAGIPADSLCVHIVGSNAEARSFAASEGVRFALVERFGDGRFCNKLVQCESALFQDADYVFLTDCDMVWLDNIEDCADLHAISGKIVDMPYPPLEILEAIFDAYGIAKPPVMETLTGKSLANNFNGGLYGIPISLLDAIGPTWKKYALDLLHSAKMMDLLGRYKKHVDQIAFSLAVNSAGLPTVNLSLGYNFPMHIIKKFLDASPDSPLSALPFSIKLLHYHGCVRDNRLLLTGNASVDAAIGRANAMIGEYLG